MDICFRNNEEIRLNLTILWIEKWRYHCSYKLKVQLWINKATFQIEDELILRQVFDTSHITQIFERSLKIIILFSFSRRIIRSGCCGSTWRWGWRRQRGRPRRRWPGTGAVGSGATQIYLDKSPLGASQYSGVKCPV